MPASLTVSEMDVLEDVARKLRHRAEVLKVGKGNLESEWQLGLADDLEEGALELESVVDGSFRNA